MNQKNCWKNIFAQDPVLAVEAVQVVDENVDQDEAVILIPLNILYFPNVFDFLNIGFSFRLATASTRGFFKIQLFS